MIFLSEIRNGVQNGVFIGVKTATKPVFALWNKKF
jgi:hypothetical protein